MQRDNDCAIGEGHLPFLEGLDRYLVAQLCAHWSKLSVFSWATAINLPIAVSRRNCDAVNQGGRFLGMSGYGGQEATITAAAATATSRKTIRFITSSFQIRVSIVVHCGNIFTPAKDAPRSSQWLKDSAALEIKSAIRLGSCNMAAWQVGSSIVIAPMACASRCSRPAVITSSCPETTNHDGFDFQAGVTVGVANKSPTAVIP